MAAIEAPSEEVSEETSDKAQRIGLVRIGVGLVLVQVAMYIGINAASSILLPARTVSAVGEANKETWLGIISTASAVFAMAAGPIAGNLSDRTRSRFGRRTPWILTFAGIFALGLALSGLPTHAIVLLLTWAIAQIGFAGMRTVVSNILPERVPLKRRGLLSGMVGLGTTLSVLLAGIIGALFVTKPLLGMLAMAALVILGAIFFSLTTPDMPNSDQSKGILTLTKSAKSEPAFPWRSLLSGFKNANFRWVWIGCFAATFGYQVIVSRMLYFFQYQFDMTLVEGATAVATATATTGLFTVVGLVGSAPLSDKFGRKPFVYLGGLGMSLGLIAITQMETFSTFLIAMGVVQFSYGMFIGVDSALTADALPEAKDFGRDLGVINLAETLPVMITPAIGTVVLALSGGSYFWLLIVGAAVCSLSVVATFLIRGIR